MEMPKICVPMTGENLMDIKKESELVIEANPDLVEWRADYYRDIESGLLSALTTINEHINAYPMIFTLRSVDEGGAVRLSQDTRYKLMHEAIESSKISYIDIERANGYEFIKPLLDMSHKAGIKVIISNHNFKHTPTKNEIIKLLEESASFGADIVKVAVMPENYGDVLTLLSASYEYNNTNNSLPTIAISMGKTGLLSRISAGLFGSIITFASLASSSAPGQIPVANLRAAMSIYS